MQVYKIKTTNIIKRNLAKEIKKAIKEKFLSDDYFECMIFYDPTYGKESFFIVDTIETEKYINYGYVYYKDFQYYRKDGNITLKKIEENIFN